MKVCIALLLISLNALSNPMEGVKVDSPKTYEIIKQNKLTKIIEISNNGKTKKEIFSKIIRDSVKWIYYSEKSGETIIVTRPMVAGPEASKFWKSKKSQVSFVGETNCLDHSIDLVSSRKIKYRCFSDDQTNPLNELEKQVVFTLK